MMIYKEIMRGMDTSSNQVSTVNPVLGKQAGYNFVILRIGNGTKKDKTFEYDYQNFKNNGYKIGIYYGNSGLSRDDAIDNAKQCLEWINGRKFDFPIAADNEISGSCSRKNAAEMNSIQHNAFTGVLRANGYPTMIYCGANRWRNYIDRDVIFDPLWLAAYKSPNNGISCHNPADINSCGRKIDLFQWTSGANKDDFFPYKLDRDILYTPLSTMMNMPETKVMHTTREITVWTMPGKKDEWRLKKIPEGYAVTVYPTKIQSKTPDGDTYYRTIKNCFVLSKYLQ